MKKFNWLIMCILAVLLLGAAACDKSSRATGQSDDDINRAVTAQIEADSDLQA
jgi:hypothetical protein